MKTLCSQSLSAVLLSLFFMVVAVSGCSRKEEPRSPAPQAAAPASAPAPAPLAGPAPAPAPPKIGAIAVADGEKPGLRVEVTELKRTGSNTVSLKFVMHNESAEKFDIEDKFIDRALKTNDRYDFSGVHLLDAVNKKKYLVVQDAENNCVCSRGLNRWFDAKSSLNLWVKLPAPPDDVQKVSVVIPHFQPMDDVPLGR